MKKNNIDDHVGIFFRSLASTTPFTSWMGQAWNEYNTNIKFDRVDEMLCNIEKRVKSIENKMGSKIIIALEQSEFCDLLENTIEKVQKERSSKKRELFAQLLTTFMCFDKNLAYDDRTNFIDTLDFLTEQDINIFSLFRPKQILRANEIVDIKTVLPSQQLNEKERANKIGISFSKLELKGLIGETYGTNYTKDRSIGGSGSKSSWLNKLREKYFELLPEGLVFRAMILETIPQNP